MTDTLKFHMTVEVMGCPTVCQHCWAMGRDYQAMPLQDISWVLHEARRFCEAHPFAYGGFPMHEVAAHPQAVQVLQLFAEIWHEDFQPFTTTGVPLATRPDWREILETLRELNAPTLWFAFHGAGDIHDRAVMRQGAYRESLRAVQLTSEVGMQSGCNLFLTKENIGQFDQLSCAMADGVPSYEEIWFPGELVPPIQELAARFGNAHSQRIHSNSFSIRDWWMECNRRTRQYE